MAAIAKEQRPAIAKEEGEVKGVGGGRMAPKKKYDTRQNAAEEQAAIATVLEEEKGAGGGKRRGSMDPKLWGDLQYHGDVLKNVYCRLPLEEFFKLRVVCKAWYCVARKRMALNEPIHKPFFTLCTPGDCLTSGILTYKKEETPWNNEFKSLPSAASTSRSSSEPKLSWVWTRHPCDLLVKIHLANESLDCSYNSAVMFPYIVSVFDWNLPTLERARAVPEVPSGFGGSGPMVIGMGVFQKEQNEFKLRAFKLVLGNLECETQVFDSESLLMEWETKPCRPVVRGAFRRTTGCASCRGLVYMTMEFSREILVYDFGNASWSSIDGPGGSAYSMLSKLPQHYRYDNLGEWEGHVLDVVDDRSSGSLSLWELVDGTKEWRVFDRMPGYLYSSLLMKSEDGTDRMAGVTIQASFCGDYVLVYSWDFQSRRAWRYCLFNMATKAWQQLEVDDNTVFIKK